MDEHKPLIPQNNSQPFEYFACESCYPPSASDDATVSGLYTTITQCNNVNDSRRRGVNVLQTALNIAKLCVGTGTLALPYAAQKGGLVFNVVGLGVIVVWNYVCSDCLLQCLDYLPSKVIDIRGERHANTLKEPGYTAYGSIEELNNEDAPSGTTLYGKIAWYASGRRGLILLDSLMMMLSVGLLTAYQAAIFSFVDGITQSTSSRVYYKIMSHLIINTLSCVEDVSFLSKSSIFGLLALALSFGVISWQGAIDNGLEGLTHVLKLNLYPKNLAAASSWFGVTVFGYGVVPFIFSFKNSMTHTQFIHLATKLGLGIAFGGYVLASNGIRILYSLTYSFDGDVLQALPDSSISIVVRLLMISVVCVTAPLIAVPCGEMIEGKLDIKGNTFKRILIRTTLCGTCTLLAMCVPGFVHVISFVGAACVSFLSFVLPPLFSLMLTRRYEPRSQVDLNLVALLVVGAATTLITAAMTFLDLVNYAQNSDSGH